MKFMATVVVEISFEGEDRPPEGAPVHVEVRDTTYIDTIAPLVAEMSGAVESDLGTRLGAVQLDVPPDAPSELTIFAHVDVDGDGGVSTRRLHHHAGVPARAVGSGGAHPRLRSKGVASNSASARAIGCPVRSSMNRNSPGGVHLQEHVLALRRAAQVDRSVHEPQPLHQRQQPLLDGGRDELRRSVRA